MKVNENGNENENEENALVKMNRYNFDYSRWDTWYVKIVDSLTI